MSKRDDAQPLNLALAATLSGLARRGQPRALDSFWGRAAGTSAAAASRPIAFADGILRVEVDTPAWAEALGGQRAELSSRLATQLPGFRALELQLRGSGR